MTKVLVTGGRDFDDRRLLFRALDRFNKVNGITLIITGKARGADKLAEDWADLRDIQCVGIEANWNDIDVPGAVVRTRKYGNHVKHYNAAAGPMRNQELLDTYDPDVCMYFKGGEGTADMMERASRWGCTMEEGEEWAK